jgi:hypothetical protein
MLKAVVEQKNIGKVVPPGSHPGGVAARSGVDQDPGEASGQFISLIPHLRRLMVKAFPVR